MITMTITITITIMIHTAAHNVPPMPDTARSGAQQSVSLCVTVSVAKCTMEVGRPHRPRQLTPLALTRVAGAARLKCVVIIQDAGGDVEVSLAAQHRPATPRLCVAGALLPRFSLQRAAAQSIAQNSPIFPTNAPVYAPLTHPLQPATTLAIGRLVKLPQACRAASRRRALAKAHRAARHAAWQTSHRPLAAAWRHCFSSTTTSETPLFRCHPQPPFASSPMRVSRAPPNSRHPPSGSKNGSATRKRSVIRQVNDCTQQRCRGLVRKHRCVILDLFGKTCRSPALAFKHPASPTSCRVSGVDEIPVVTLAPPTARFGGHWH
jgi:hypothetical protein